MKEELDVPGDGYRDRIPVDDALCAVPSIFYFAKTLSTLAASHEC